MKAANSDFHSFSSHISGAYVNHYSIVAVDGFCTMRSRRSLAQDPILDVHTHLDLVFFNK